MAGQRLGSPELGPVPSHEIPIRAVTGKLVFNTFYQKAARGVTVPEFGLRFPGAKRAILRAAIT